MKESGQESPEKHRVINVIYQEYKFNTRLYEEFNGSIILELQLFLD